MDFKEYEKEAEKTAKYPHVGHSFIYPLLGLSGETGEVVEKIKKILRDKDGVISDLDREELKKELGDVLWYLSRISVELGLTLEDVAKTNIDKLSSRLERGEISGEGDNR